MGFFDRPKRSGKRAASVPAPGHQAATDNPHNHTSPPKHSSSSPAPLPWHTSNPAPQPAGYLPAPLGWTPGPTVTHNPPYPPQPWPQPIVVNQYYLAPAAGHNLTTSGNTATQRPVANKPSLGKLNLGSMVNLVAQEAVPVTINVAHAFDDTLFNGACARLVGQTTGIYDDLSARFNDIMTGIDGGKYKGSSADVGQIMAPPPAPHGAGAPPVPQPGYPYQYQYQYQYHYQHPQQPPSQPPPLPMPPADGSSDHTKGRLLASGKPVKHRRKKGSAQAQAASAVATAIFTGSYWNKVDLYSNSRLPLRLPEFRVHIPTYPLLCLAATTAAKVYDKPRGAEREALVGGTRAMVMKSAPLDDNEVIVFAVRGTATFIDWAVNLNMAPVSPAGFLDDPGNLCHAGFLSLARSMIPAVADRLRALLQEDPRRAGYSLLMTGHSAGGAVASLLYAHMLASSRQAESELNVLAGFFRRIHCITFGTPPVSLLPLRTPDPPSGKEEGWVGRKSQFITFLNEGDPVARADTAYVKSLLELFAHPAPVIRYFVDNSTGPPHAKLMWQRSPDRRQLLPSTAAATSTELLRPSRPPPTRSSSSTSGTTTQTTPSIFKPHIRGNNHHHPGPVWPVPQCALSVPGQRIVVLRSGNPHDWRERIVPPNLHATGARGGTGAGKGKNGKGVASCGNKSVAERLDEGVVAQVVTDEQLRGVVWGDPVAHLMELYARRVECLAVGAVTGGGRTRRERESERRERR